MAGNTAPDFLGGGGQMGALIRAHDWSSTLGPPERWPRSLKTAVRVMLTSRQPTWIGWGAQLIYLYNDAYRDVIGGKHPWALGRPIAEVWSEILGDIAQSLDNAIRGDEGTYVEGKLLIMERNGYPEETYYTYSYSPVPDDDGRPGGIICFNTDDTRRVIGDRQLATLRDQAAAAVSVRDWREACERSIDALAANRHDVPFAAIYVAEADGAFALAAARGIEPGHAAMPARVMHDDRRTWPLADALSRRETVMVHGLPERFGGDRLPHDVWPVPPQQAALLSIPASGERGRHAVLVVALNPYRLYDESYAGFLELAAGQIGAAIAQADAYEEERRRAEELARLDQAKTLFFSNVSHEFRTPLTLMLGPLEEWLARADAAPSDSRALVELAHGNGQRLLKLVNTLLDFARIEAGRAQARYEPTDLCKLTTELASSFRSAIEKAGLALEVHCADDLPAVYVDREMWEKIVLNLLSNAFKFTFEGRIAVNLQPDGDHVVLTVNDTGTGIPATELPHLFERFHRVEGARGRSIEGSGIGLALVRELVGLHGGELAVESIEGRGSTFVVRLPLGKAHLEAARVTESCDADASARHIRPFIEEAMRWLPADAAPADFVPPPDAGNGRILLADDNRDMCQYVERLLQGAGWQVECVGDGEAALAAIRRERPVLLLTDVMMPKLDGIALVKTLRADPALSLLPVILLSARAGEEARVEGIAAGADDYLVKPFTARELLVRVQSHVALAGMRRETAERERALREKAERAEHTLRHRTTQFENLLQAAPIGVYLVDAGLRILELNPLARDFFGEPEPLGQHLSDAMRRVREAAVTEAALHRFRDTLATGLPYASPGRFERRPGQDAPEAHAWEIHRIGLPDGSHGVVCYFRDVRAELEAQRDILQSREALQELNATLEERVANEIAERAKAEEQLRQSQKMEAIGHLTGGVAHDFNNLLTVIIGNLELVQRHAAQGATQRLARFTDNAMLGARRAATLTQRLLAFARRQPLEPRPVDANRLVLGMFDLLARTLGESITVDTVLASDLWQVEADANQLENVLLNLVVNARDAMPQGGRLRIETANTHVGAEAAQQITDATPGAYVRMTVTDTGAGMPPEVRDRVFEPFFTTKPTGHGTGLGLSQVYGFVRQSGGFVTLESAPGQGTSVRIHLPRLVAGQTVATDEAVAVPDVGGGETILVVEDNPDVREYTCLLLQELGYTVLAAEDAPAALLLLTQHPDITLLLSDIGLPGMNGRELAEHALAQRPDLKVLFVSGYARQAIVHDGRVDPGVQMLAKPFTYAELAEKLAEVLASRQVH